MILSLIKVRTVCLSELAAGFAWKAKTGSNEKRIHRFLKNFYFPAGHVAHFVASKLPKGQWILTMDRTFREFGKLKINILMLAVVYKGVAIPLLWKFPGEADSGKKGSSDTGERIGLITGFIRFCGAYRNALCGSGVYRQ